METDVENPEEPVETDQVVEESVDEWISNILIFSFHPLLIDDILDFYVKIKQCILVKLYIFHYIKIHSPYYGA